MFKVAVNNFVQSIGSDVYLPSPSAGASKNLSPLSLVERKESRLPLRRYNRYYTTEFTLQDVIDGRQSLEIEPAAEDYFCTFNRESTVKVEGMLKGYLKGIFDAGVRKVDSVAIKTELGELKIVEVPLQSLLKGISSCKMRMDHQLVRELSSTNRRALCVVTGVVKTTSDITLSFKLGQELSAEATASVTSALPGQVVGGTMKGTHETDSSRVLNLPAGTVLAYQVSELAVSNKGEIDILVRHGAKGGFYKANKK